MSRPVRHPWHGDRAGTHKITVVQLAARAISTSSSASCGRFSEPSSASPPRRGAWARTRRCGCPTQCASDVLVLRALRRGAPPRALVACRGCAWECTGQTRCIRSEPCPPRRGLSRRELANPHHIVPLLSLVAVYVGEDIGFMGGSSREDGREPANLRHLSHLANQVSVYPYFRTMYQPCSLHRTDHLILILRVTTLGSARNADGSAELNIGTIEIPGSGSGSAVCSPGCDLLS